MFYFRIINDTVIQIAADLTLENYRDPSWISRHDITSFEHAEKVSGQNNRIVTTSTGRKYYRRRLSGAWVADKFYSMARGHISRLNPEF